MSVLNAPGPLFDWLDRVAAGPLPSWLRLLLWGALAALVSMLLYRLLSSQEQIRKGKQELRLARQRLNAYEGPELKGAWPMMRAMLGSNFRQLGRIAWPAVVASLPLLFLLAWMSNAYGYVFPPAGTSVNLRTVPEKFQAQWAGADELAGGRYPHIVVFDEEKTTMIAEVPMPAAVPVIHKWRWWNVLVGNPAGYLPDSIPIDAIYAQLPPMQHLNFGPDWMRRWGFLFFATLLVTSVGLKIGLKIA